MFQHEAVMTKYKNYQIVKKSTYSIQESTKKTSLFFWNVGISFCCFLNFGYFNGFHFVVFSFEGILIWFSEIEQSLIYYFYQIVFERRRFNLKNGFENALTWNFKRNFSDLFRNMSTPRPNPINEMLSKNIR